MAKGYVLYNPLAGNGQSAADARLLELVMQEELQFFDITKITNYRAFLADMEEEDYLVLVGGDGTLSRFANDTADIRIVPNILYFPAGSGNDFARDLGKAPLSQPFPIAQYLVGLPSVEIKGKQYFFLNGVGFGIDGYCCQVGDVLKKQGKEVNYAAIAVRGLLGGFAPRNATVTVDGKPYAYQKVWIAPTMYGRYYGGGMMPAPEQDRENSDGTLSLMVFHSAGKLRTLCIFPGLFQGSHTKHTKNVAIHTGHEITVEFDRPTPLQIDGETLLDVTCYTARSAKYTPAQKDKRMVVL